MEIATTTAIVAIAVPRESGRDRDEQNRLLENARILATLNIAMADAAIGCWDAKWEYHFWRPITAIREADPANKAITRDPGWTTLFATPAHQDYPSGHSCVSGAATTVLADEFGERTRFSVTSDLILGASRSFRSFSDALEDVKNARIFAGIHFRTACDDGTKIGLAVGRYGAGSQLPATEVGPSLREVARAAQRGDLHRAETVLREYGFSVFPEQRRATARVGRRLAHLDRRSQ